MSLHTFTPCNAKANTGFSGTIYADPSRVLYRKLGMTIENLQATPAGEEKRSYVSGMLSTTLRSIWVPSHKILIP